jgi:hypothetical protein
VYGPGDSIIYNGTIRLDRTMPIMVHLSHDADGSWEHAWANYTFTANVSADYFQIFGGVLPAWALAAPDSTRTSLVNLTEVGAEWNVLTVYVAYRYNTTAGGATTTGGSSYTPPSKAAPPVYWFDFNISPTLWRSLLALLIVAMVCTAFLKNRRNIRRKLAARDPREWVK